MLIYSLLYLTGYGISLEELQNFRQWGSRTPGHPEYGLTPGVEVTTGPLGQGFVNGVGMAVAESHLAAEFNKTGYPIFDHFIFAIVTDGDLMEGISSEAASFAGHQKLGKLIYLYDDNRITIDGSTEITFTEDRAARFRAYNWNVLSVADGNDVDAVDEAIQKAKADPRPSLIICRTHIGYGLPTRQDTEKAHGTPPGDVELNGAKEKLGWPVEPRFYVPEDVLRFFRGAVTDGEKYQREWNSLVNNYSKNFPESGKELTRRLEGKLPDGWEKSLPVYPADVKGMATRSASGKAINALSVILPELMGGSADLAPSNNTWIEGQPAFQADSRQGRNFHFGVREFGMAGIVNGMAVYGCIIPYAATFLVFSDYLRGALRVSALSHYPTIWVFTHDSIGVGEDGPTHQPVEHIAALRAIPNFVTLRPADANETSEAWKIAIGRRNAPTALILTRQNLPVLDRSVYASASGLVKGAYILADLGGKKPQIILMASGSEVSLIVEAGNKLAAEGYGVRIVSFPSWELFKNQGQKYIDTVMPKEIEKRIAVEAGISMGWERWVGNTGEIIAIDKYGASAPANKVFAEYGFTVDNILNRAREILA